MRVTLQTTINASWTDLAPVRVGKVPDGLGTPDVYALVLADGEPFLRIDLYAPSEECFAFQEAIAWRDFIVIGYGSRVYLIAQRNRQARTYLLEGYFGYLYPAEDLLFVASATNLLCLDGEGTLLWTSEPLGVDGVIVDSIESDSISGRGEWDPPGGWQAFQINAHTGTLQNAPEPD